MAKGVTDIASCVQVALGMESLQLPHIRNSVYLVVA